MKDLLYFNPMKLESYQLEKLGPSGNLKIFLLSSALQTFISIANKTFFGNYA